MGITMQIGKQSQGVNFYLEYMITHDRQTKLKKHIREDMQSPLDMPANVIS
jgi:hypothetical protein